MTWLSFSTMREIAENTWNGMPIKDKERILNQEGSTFSDAHIRERSKMDLEDIEKIGFDKPSMGVLIDHILEESDDERLKD